MSESTAWNVKDLEKARKYLGWAIQNEIDGHAFYMEAAEKTSAPAGEQVFRSLALDELDHLHLLERQLAVLEEQNALAGFDASSVRHATGKEYPRLFTQELAEDSFELKALKHGIRIEHKAINMYSKAKDELPYPEAQAIFSFLITQERQHAFILESEYEYIAGSGFHYGSMEFSLEQSDGA